MSTITLACTGANFLSYKTPGTAIVKNDVCPTCYALVDPKLSETQKAFEANRNPYNDCGGAILEFQSDVSLKYKKINSVRLNYTLAVESYVMPAVLCVLLRPQANGVGYEYVAGYLSNAALNEITLSNFKTVGNVQSGITNEVTAALSGQTSASRNIDITDIYKSNFAGETSRLLIATGASYPSFLSSSYATYFAGSQYIKRQITVTGAYLVVDYEDVVQPAPSPTYPNNVTLMENIPVNFTWVFNSETLATQQSADIQYKIKTAGEWTTVTSSSAAPTWTLEQGLPQGTYVWRARVTNILDETSDWSDTVEFEVIGRPASPIITSVENKCLTTIQWNASNQDAFEIMLYQGEKLIAHETIASSITSYKPQLFLKGNYSIKLRFKSYADLWSDFAEYAFVIDGTEPLAGELQVIPLDTYVRLEWTVETGVNSVIVRKEKGIETVLTDSVNATKYDDKTVKGGVIYEYVLRTWTDGYTDTHDIQASCNYTGAIISKDGEELLLKISEETFMPHSGIIGRDYALDKFEGREYPMLETGRQKEHVISRRFFVKSEELEKLFALTEDLQVYYRDEHNNAFKAAVTKLDYHNYMQRGYIVQIELTRLAEDEVKINV